MQQYRQPTKDIFDSGFDMRLNRGMDNESIDVYKLSASDKTYLKKLLSEISTFGVNTVNGKVGDVVLTTSDIGEGTNLYYTDERTQDGVGGILSNEFTYDDGTPSISLNYSNISLLDVISMTDPDDDRILFWDDSEGDFAWLDMGTNISITGTTLNVAGAGVSELSDLTDVNTSTPTNRNVLIADGVDWESRALDAADIQGGTFVDARIAESNITQHQAALSITESQISDLDHTDSDAIHDNIAAEISAITEKPSPIAGDFLLIEDSADSNNKKRIQIGNVPVAALLPVVDSTNLVEGSSDSTKQLRLEVDGLTTSTTRVWTAQDSDLTVAGLDVTQTFTEEQTFTARVSSTLNSASGSEFFGTDAGHTSTTGTNNTVVGQGAGTSSSLGSNNVIIGQGAATSLTGDNNTIIGKGAGLLTTGDDNLFLGKDVGAVNTSGSSNVYVGPLCGASSTTSSFATFFGWSCGNANTTGNFNSYFGARAGRYNTTGNQNAGFGGGSLENNAGTWNIALGIFAGANNDTGQGNSFLGAYTDVTGAGTWNYSIALGAFAKTTAANQFIIGASFAQINEIRIPGTTRPVIKEEDSSTNGITNIIGIGHNSSGTPATNFGVGFNAALDSSTTSDQDAGRLVWQWDTATHASRAAKGFISAYYTTTERKPLQWAANSSASLLGFYDTTPIIQPSGTGETSGFTAGSGTGVNDDSTFTGNVGSTAYRISDIVKALKNLGLLAQ